MGMSVHSVPKRVSLIQMTQGAKRFILPDALFMRGISEGGARSSSFTKVCKIK
jgi:hypothetical protein